MRNAVRVFSIAFALGATIPAPGAGAQPTQISSCQTISDPGSYMLVNNLSASGDCLVITTSFVTINLAGFTISGENASGTGIKAAPTSGRLQGIAVRNGSITDFDTGVDLSSADGSIVEGLRVSGVGGFVGITVTNGLVKGNTLTGSYSGAAIGALASVVTGNNVSNTDSVGFDINNGITGSGSTVIGNTAKGNTHSIATIIATCPANLIDNTAVGNLPGRNLLLQGSTCHTANNVAP